MFIRRKIKNNIVHFINYNYIFIFSCVVVLIGGAIPFMVQTKQCKRRLIFLKI